MGLKPYCENSLVSGGADSKLNEGDLTGENLFVADSEASESFMGENQDGKIIAKHTTQIVEDVAKFDNGF